MFNGKVSKILIVCAAIVSFIAGICTLVASKYYENTAFGIISIVIGVLLISLMMFAKKDNSLVLIIPVVALVITAYVMFNSLNEYFDDQIAQRTMLDLVLAALLVVATVFALKDKAKWACVTVIAVVAFKLIDAVNLFVFAYDEFSETVFNSPEWYNTFYVIGLLGASLTIVLGLTSLVALFATPLLKTDKCDECCCKKEEAKEEEAKEEEKTVEAEATEEAPAEEENKETSESEEN